MSAAIVMLVLSVLAAGCGKRPAPVTQPAPPPQASVAPPSVTPAPPPPPARVEDALPVPPPPLAEDAIGNRSLDDLNRDSPFKPAFFQLDSADLDDAGRAAVTGNAEVLRRYPSWTVTIEGHCDERGSAEYNLALGERRASAIRDYLVSLGIGGDRLLSVSRGEESPQCTEENEACYMRNRRGHFLFTAK